MRLLFITATRIGDAVLSTGVLDHLIAQQPGTRVTVACGPSAVPLFEAVPGLEAVLPVKKRRYNLHWLKLWAQTGTRFWDQVVDLRASAIAYLVPTRRRLVGGARQPQLHRVVELGRLLGLAEPPAPRLWLTAEDRAAAERLLPEGAPLLALGASASWVGKRWPAERFVGLATRLTGPGGILPRARLAIFAGPGERDQVAPLIAAFEAGRVIDLVGRVSLREAAACLARADLFIGNDTGLMHLAAAAGTPTLGLFGPSPDQRYAPWGPRCAVVRTAESFEALTSWPQFDHNAVHDSLMTSLTVDAAAAAAEALWQRVAAARDKSPARAAR